MKKIFGLVLGFVSFLTTQSFASSLNVTELKKITNSSSIARNGTGTCITSTREKNK